MNYYLEFDFGSIASNLFGAALNTAIGKDCKGRPQGDYFFGCQVHVFSREFGQELSNRL